MKNMTTINIAVTQQKNGNSTAIAFTKNNKELENSTVVDIQIDISDTSTDYPYLWFALIRHIWIEYKEQVLLLAEIYPSEAGNIRGLIEDELKLLDQENTGLFVKHSLSERYKYLYQYIFSVNNEEYLFYLINAYYDHKQSIFYLANTPLQDECIKLIGESTNKALQDVIDIVTYCQGTAFSCNYNRMTIITSMADESILSLLITQAIEWYNKNKELLQTSWLKWKSK